MERASIKKEYDETLERIESDEIKINCLKDDIAKMRSRAAIDRKRLDLIEVEWLKVASCVCVLDGISCDACN